MRRPDFTDLAIAAEREAKRRMSADTEGRMHLDRVDPLAPKRCDQHIPLTRADGKKLALAAVQGVMAGAESLAEDVGREITASVRALTRKINRLERLIMATQADVDAVTAALVQQDSDLNAAVSQLGDTDARIEAKIEELQNANPSIDLSGLQAELANSKAATQAVADAVSATAALVPAPVDNPPAGGGDTGSGDGSAPVDSGDGS